MKFRLLTLLAAAGLVAAAACNDLTGTQASFPVAFDSLSIYALNGTPRTAPVALVLPAAGSGSAARAVTGAFNFDFDLAFDIDSAGRAMIYPVQLVSGASSAYHQVGTQVLPNTEYATLERAPGGKYRYDSAAVVPVGTTVAIEDYNANMCPYSYYGTTYYAKLVVDSIIPDERRLVIRMAVDVNCGFRSFKPGTPKD